MPKLYKHLHGPNGLAESDAAWAHLLVPDRTGFRGLTSSSVVVATCDRRCFTPDGYRNAVEADDDAAGGAQYELMDGDVVCFESALTDTTGVHAAVMIDDFGGALPPNTLYRLKRVVPAGEWSVDGVVLEEKKGEKKGKSPLKSKRKDANVVVERESLVYPKQRLLVVSTSLASISPPCPPLTAPPHSRSAVPLSIFPWPLSSPGERHLPAAARCGGRPLARAGGQAVRPRSHAAIRLARGIRQRPRRYARAAHPLARPGNRWNLPRHPMRPSMASLPALPAQSICPSIPFHAFHGLLWPSRGLPVASRATPPRPPPLFARSRRSLRAT